MIVNPEFLKCIKNINNGLLALKNLNINYEQEIDFKKFDTVFYCEPNVKKFDYVAAFDLDWTLTYNEKHLFPKESDDIFILPERRILLEKAIKLGYTLVVFTNQYAKSKNEKQKKVDRVANFVRKLKLPVYVYIATEKDEYRKPEIGMWKLFTKNLNKSVKKVFFVGDALGRPQDFSDSDRLFGEKLGINVEIKSPEEFFGSNKNISLPKNLKKELIIFVGMPGSGKSTYYKEHLSDYIHIEQDKIGTKNKLFKEIIKSLQTGKSIVIDSTNPSQENREEYYKEAIKYNYNIKVLYFLVNGHGYNKLRDKPVPDVVYHIYFKKLVPPTLENTPGEVIHIF